MVKYSNLSCRTIDALGGVTSVARKLKVTKGMVSGWRKEGIPPRRWAEFVRLAERRREELSKITFEALARSDGMEARS